MRNKYITRRKEGLPVNTLSFHLSLISDLISKDEYPFTKLMIDKAMTEHEYDELFRLLEELNSCFIQQKEEGLLDYTKLLVHFAGMLNEKLHPDETLNALRKEGHYTEMIDTFMETISKSDKRGRKWR